MRTFSVALILCLSMLCGCGERREECQFDRDDYFLLDSLDMSFKKQNPRELDAILVETPCAGTSGYFILRDTEGNDYRFESWTGMDWEEQLDGLQLGKTYHFALWSTGFGDVAAMKILEEDLLVYLALSDGGVSPSAMVMLLIKEPGFLEGFTAEQLRESKCDPIRRETRLGDVSLSTNLPMVFGYGDQSVTLYPGQEERFITPYGEFLVHLSSSRFVDPQNYENGGHSYSFYIKRP